MLGALAPSRAAWEANVARFGARATWRQDGIVAAADIPAGYSVPRDTDPAVANALGVGIRLVTLRAIDTAGGTPRRLDRLDVQFLDAAGAVVGAESLTIDFATPVLFAGELFGWRCTCAGIGLTP
jgi:hypothetical protein